MPRTCYFTSARIYHELVSWYIHICRVINPTIGQEERVLNRREQTFCSVFPHLLIGEVSHNSCAVKENGRVVRPLSVVKLGAIDGVVGAIEDLVVGRDEADAVHPVPCTPSPIHVCLVASKAG